VTYRVLIDPRAAKHLESLPKPVIPRIDGVVLALAENPRPVGAKRLRGKLREGWRIRVGEYRVLYRIDNVAKQVRIFDIGQRRNIYR